MAALVATLQVDASRKGDRASLLGARLAVQISERIASSQLRSDFHLNTQRQAGALGISGLVRQIAALPLGDRLAFEVEVGKADLSASQRLLAAALEMEQISPRARGLDRLTAAAILATPAQLQAQVLEQGRQVDLASRYSMQGSRSVFALSLVVIAAALLGLAAVLKAGPPGRIALGAGVLALAASVGWAAWALTA